MKKVSNDLEKWGIIRKAAHIPRVGEIKSMVLRHFAFIPWGSTTKTGI